MQYLKVSRKYGDDTLDGYAVIPCLAKPYINSVYKSVNGFRNAINNAGLVAPSGTSIKTLLDGKKTEKPADTCILFLNQEHSSKSGAKPYFDQIQMTFAAEVVVKTKVETLRQKEKLTRLELAQSLGTLELVIDWVEGNKPVSEHFAQRLADFFNLKYTIA